MTPAQRVAEQSSPIAERILRGLSYLGVALAAIWLLVLPPSGVGSDLGRTLTVIWCAFLLTSVPAAIGAFLGRYRAEYACIPWFVGALILALIHAWFEVSGGALEIAPRALISTALVFKVAARFVALHQLVKVRPKEGPWTRRPSK